ncbi:MAG TPA: STAS domain-containing protein, partial [Candidatus Sumerlaeota bacterium]|nr:STAS domain-containing protein [Candidatus Sumerlaeota bacterium]
MEINIYRANNNLYIDISGRVVLDVCEHLKNAAIPLIDKGINQVYVDLSAVDFVDSAGLGIMVGLKMTSNKSKARM